MLTERLTVFGDMH